MLIRSELYRSLIDGRLLSILDGGARGDLFEPFRGVDRSLLFVIAFDPDPDAPIVRSEHGACFRAALWSKPELVKLHVAVEPTTSSLFAADNEVLDPFHDRNGYPKRRSVRVLDVPGVSLDSILEAQPDVPTPDLIKLDIHGSEYEALEGASKALETTIAVVAETWTLPIHKGQKTHCEVECLLYREGFVLFHTERVMEMERKKPDDLVSRYQTVGYENLYFKANIESTDRAQALKAIAISEAYGHAAYSLQLVEHSSRAGLLSAAEAAALGAEIARLNRVPGRLQKLARGVRRRLRL